MCEYEYNVQKRKRVFKKKEKRNTRSSMCVRDSMMTHAEGEAISGLLIYMHACRAVVRADLHAHAVRRLCTMRPHKSAAWHCHPMPSSSIDRRP